MNSIKIEHHLNCIQGKITQTNADNVIIIVGIVMGLQIEKKQLNMKLKNQMDIIMQKY
jgi:hypothetical protein